MPLQKLQAMREKLLRYPFVFTPGLMLFVLLGTCTSIAIWYEVGQRTRHYREGIAEITAARTGANFENQFELQTRVLGRVHVRVRDNQPQILPVYAQNFLLDYPAFDWLAVLTASGEPVWQTASPTFSEERFQEMSTASGLPAMVQATLSADQLQLQLVEATPERPAYLVGVFPLSNDQQAMAVALNLKRFAQEIIALQGVQFSDDYLLCVFDDRRRPLYLPPGLTAASLQDTVIQVPLFLAGQEWRLGLVPSKSAVVSSLLPTFILLFCLVLTALVAAVWAQLRVTRYHRRWGEELNEALLLKNQELKRQAKELERKQQEVEAFVYIVSHDLRAPLVNLQGFCRELRMGCTELAQLLGLLELPPDQTKRVQELLDDEIESSLRFISASTDKFERLITALLNLSRTGRQEYRAVPLDMTQLANTTFDSVRHSLDQQRIEARVEPLPEAIGDVTAIGQVLSNIVDNAIKYAKPGVPGTIMVSGTRENGMCHYTIRDTGLGMPRHAQAKFFQVFQRFHPDVAQGEGMGLVIVKRIIERHGGEAWLESEEGLGTAFHFTLCAEEPTGRENIKSES